MGLPRRIRLIDVLATGAVLIAVAYTRGIGPEPGPSPSPRHGSFATEEAWIVNEIVRDITEMSAYPATAATTPVIVAERAMGPMDVAVPGQTGTMRVELDGDPWVPGLFEPFARAAIAGFEGGPRSDHGIAAVHPSLLDLSASSLVVAAGAVSRALEADMRNGLAHEAAAVTIGAFALRESADRFRDARWAMNRMTAHLAVARALRRGGDAGMDGQLAEVLLSTLANRQTEALRRLRGLVHAASEPAVAAWVRALRVRITADWRVVPSPADATLLEKQEYFRARRATATGGPARAELGALGVEPAASWFRILQEYPMGIDDAWLMTQALEWERGEAAAVHQRLYNQPLPAAPADALNARATRLVTAGRVQVIPWGAWAEFFQRHLAMFLDRANSFYRTLGDERQALARVRRLDDHAEELALFPLARMYRTGVSGGTSPEVIAQAAALAAASPDRIPPHARVFLEQATAAAASSPPQPGRRGWLMPASPRLMHEAAVRVPFPSPDEPETIDAMLRAAPYDYRLVLGLLKVRHGADLPFDEVDRRLGVRLPYDLAALRWVVQLPASGDARVGLRERMCRLSVDECPALAREYARAARTVDAAGAFERAFAHPDLDPVVLADTSAWLVTYYLRHGRVEAAIDLAERSAAIGSAQGLVTCGSLYERLGRMEEAEAKYLQSAGRDSDGSQLFGFYYRAVRVRGDARFDPGFQAAAAALFPGGLQAAQTTDARPSRGVVVTRSSSPWRVTGLEPGDVIVGLEGWRVENLPQYRGLLAALDRDLVTLLVWRGKLVKLTLQPPDPGSGVELQSYPQ